MKKRDGPNRKLDRFKFQNAGDKPDSGMLETHTFKEYASKQTGNLS